MGVGWGQGHLAQIGAMERVERQGRGEELGQPNSGLLRQLHEICVQSVRHSTLQIDTYK